MNQDQILLRAARLLERASQRRPAKPELPLEPWDLLEVYFADPCRPRLTPTAYLVWAYLLRRADAESRIATVSYRELRMKTGILSTRSLRQAILELTRLGYCVPSTVPTGPGLPKNYKIPDHIGTKRFAHPDVLRLSREADQPRRRPHRKAWMIAEEARRAAAYAPLKPVTPPPPRPSIPPALEPGAEPGAPLRPIVPPAAKLNLDEKIEQLGQEVDQLLQVFSKKDPGPSPGPETK
jgi:hypothetical protein